MPKCDSTTGKQRTGRIGLPVLAAVIVLGLHLWACGSESTTPVAPAGVSSDGDIALGPATSEDDPGSYDIHRLSRRQASRISNWCVYEIIYANISDPNCPLTEGEQICVACPGEGSCPGDDGSAKWFYIYNPAGSLAGYIEVVYVSGCGNCGRHRKYAIQ